jgi:hypothetical protein
MKLITATTLACILLAAPFAAQEVRLPPSVGATPIEIPYVDPDAPLVMKRPTLIPGAVSTLPVPIPSDGITRLDPRQTPGRFSALPIPIPGDARVGHEGRFTMRS